MGTLCRAGENQRVALESEHTIGRSAECRLVLLKPYVSTHHALIQWSEAGWEIRDLGSTNGTWLNGECIRTGEKRTLAEEDVLAFGHLDERWRVEDIAPPRTLLLPLEGGNPIAVNGDLCGLPSSDNPLATLFRDGLGT